MGAGKSLMDIGTVEKLKLNTLMQQLDDELYDASGNKMDVIGTIRI